MKKTSPSVTVLRQEAEGRLERRPQTTAAVSPEDTSRLVHELQVHQIELELQNEELGKAYSTVAALRDKYLDLYDFAPVGYFTLTRAGNIAELNLSAALLLGEARDTLVGRRLQDFVQPESAAAFAEFLLKAAATQAELSATFTVRHSGNETLYVRAQARTLQSAATHGTEIQIVMVDLTALKSANDELMRSFEKFFRYWRP